MSWHDLNGHTTTFAYVVMPDHVHWLFALGETQSLSRVMASMKKHSAKLVNQALVNQALVNQALRRSGLIWQPGFPDHARRCDKEVEQVAWCVIHNPVKSGIVEDIQLYPLWDAKWLPAHSW